MESLPILLTYRSVRLSLNGKFLYKMGYSFGFAEYRTVVSNYLSIILLGLHIPKRGILSFASQKFLVGAFFNEPPGFQN